MIRVFVSSVSRDLETVRRHIISELQTAGHDIGAMERFGAQPQPPIDVCLREVRNADVVVLLIGPRYGSLLPQGISYTQAEFREAQGNGIPVLAFRIANEASLADEEVTQLAGFETEVGATTTYVALSPNESLDRLPGKVLAALSSAMNRGELGHRFSVFQRYERFFAGQLGGTTALFNHEGPFIGRDAQLKRLVEFLEGNESVLLLKAPGGSGKSRLLLEAAKTVEGIGSPHVFFVDSAASWSAEDVNRLPSEPTVLVFDDAHRRPDLDRIVAASLQHNKSIRSVVSCRPSAVGIVTPLLGPLTDGEPAEIELRVLSKTDAQALAQHYLGSPLQHLAERLVSIADRNPLVVRVGARCIADKLVVPEMLERTPEAFRRLVLDRLLADPAISSSDSTARRQVLEVIAAIGPVVTEHDELIAQLATIVKLPDYEVRRLLASLERSQFLIRRGRLVRVSPDVLADHLLYKAAVDDTGKPSGFIDTMVTLFRPSLENILGNAAELDWRSATTAPGSEPVLRTIWQDLLSFLPTASNRLRTELVGQLKRAAIFAPADVLTICEWLVEHRDAPNDELLSEWGLEDTPDRVTEAVTDIVALIAPHPDFTWRCATQLWLLGTLDQRPLNPHPSHPRRRLADLVKYERRSDWESPDGAHARTINFLIDRLKDTARTESAPWAVSALANALSRTGEANEWNRRVFTLREFSLARFAGNFGDRRRAVIQCLNYIALGPRLDEAAAALTDIGALLRAPRGPFGRGLEADEIAAWQPEAERAISLLQAIGTSAESEVARYLARRELRSVHVDHWPDIAPAVHQALNNTAPVRSERLYDLLIGTPWEEQLDDWSAEETRVDALCRTAADAFWHEHNSPHAVVEALLTAVAIFQGIGRQTDSQVGRLVHALVLTSTHDPREFVAQLVAREAGWPMLRPALLAAHEKHPALAEHLASELAASVHDVVRASALEAVQWMVDRAADLKPLVELTRTLSQDPTPLVRGASARVLRRLAKRVPAEALDILTQIDWAGELWLADAVLGALDSQAGLDPKQLTDAGIDSLLSRVEQLRTLEGRNYEVFQFIAFASERRPRQTVETLIRRIKAIDEHQGEKGDERWLPMPYSGRGLSLPGVQHAGEHQELVRLIRDAALGATSMVRFWLPTLFQLADPNLTAGRVVLREWLTAGESERIVAAASLLRGFDHAVVFSEHELIAELLVAANMRGSECLQDTRTELSSLAISGVYSGVPGEPAPRHLHDRAEAERLAEKYASNPPVRDFYGSLRDHAESSIRMDVALWDEEDAE